MRYLVPMTVLAVIPTFFLASTGVVGSLMLFGVALIGFNLGSIVYYDAMPPTCRRPENVGVVSGLGSPSATSGRSSLWGVGRSYWTIREPLLCSAHISVLSSCSALPTFFWVRERPRTAEFPGVAPDDAKEHPSPRGFWRKARTLPGVGPLPRRQISLYRRGQHAHRRISDDRAKEELGFTLQ